MKSKSAKRRDRLVRREASKQATEYVNYIPMKGDFNKKLTFAYEQIKEMNTATDSLFKWHWSPWIYDACIAYDVLIAERGLRSRNKYSIGRLSWIFTSWLKRLVAR